MNESNNHTVAGSVHWRMFHGWDGDDWGESCDCEIGEDHWDGKDKH